MWICANCGCNLNGEKDVAESAIYSPHESFDLCLPCDEEEEREIDEEGTNDLPERLAKYHRVVRNEYS